MNILEINMSTLANLYDQFPESFKDLSMQDNYLVYNGEKVDISKFNINDLLGSETSFAASLGILRSEDIFKIIRLHAIHLESKLDVRKKDNANKIEVIKKENPLMKNISIATRRINGSLVEYINIVDSRGESHLFENDRNVNIFDIYEELKIRSAGKDITPDELIDEINRRLYQIQMQKAGAIMDNTQTSEDFANKIKRVNDPYKNDKTTDVFGNVEHDVAIVSDLDDPSNHRVVTFDKNQFGDLVLENHEQNVIGTDTTLSRNGNIESSTSETGTSDSSTTEGEVFEKDNVEIAALLISTQEFYDLLNSPEELTEEQRKSVDLYYGYFGDLILYEDYLLPELKQILEDYRRYVYELQFGEVPEGQERQINNKQQEAVDKSYELENKAASIQSEELTDEKVKDGIKKLELIKPVNDYNSGSISIIQVLAIIIGVSIILTAITLYLLG